MTKMLTEKERDNIYEQNKARERAGLKPLTIRIRRCLLCRQQFESAGKRSCGCDADKELSKLEQKFHPRGK